MLKKGLFFRKGILRLKQLECDVCGFSQVKKVIFVATYGFFV